MLVAALSVTYVYLLLISFHIILSRTDHVNVLLQYLQNINIHGKTLNDNLLNH